MKALTTSLLFALFLLAFTVTCDSITCPLTTCYETLQKDRCVEVNYEFPYE